MAAFKVTIEEAEKLGVDAILANDPDADRLGVVLKHEGPVDPDDRQRYGGSDPRLPGPGAPQGVKGAVVTTVVTSDFLAEGG